MRRPISQVGLARTIRAVFGVMLCAVVAACATRPHNVVQQPSPKVALPPLPPPGEPADLAGLRSGALVAALGSPAFVRRDGAIETWRYDAPGCKAFFFLYPYGGGLLVRHVETVPRGRDMAADRQCLESLRARPAPAAS